jgi:hypothetical protein
MASTNPTARLDPSLVSAVLPAQTSTHVREGDAGNASLNGELLLLKHIENW